MANAGSSRPTRPVHSLEYKATSHRYRQAGSNETEGIHRRASHKSGSQSSSASSGFGDRRQIRCRYSGDRHGPCSNAVFKKMTKEEVASYSRTVQTVIGIISLENAVVARLKASGNGSIPRRPPPPCRPAYGRAGSRHRGCRRCPFNVFGNASREQRPSDESLEKVFHTTDFADVAKKIIEKAIGLIADQRRRDDRGEAPAGDIAFYRAKFHRSPALVTSPAGPGMRGRWKRPGEYRSRSSTLTNWSRKRSRRCAQSYPLRFEELPAGHTEVPADDTTRAYGDIAAQARSSESGRRMVPWVPWCGNRAGIEGEFYESDKQDQQARDG